MPPPDPDPQARRLVRRPDGEAVGAVIADGASWLPATVFGAPIAPAEPTEQAAEAILLDRGLAALAGEWWVELLDRGWARCWLVEVHADRLRISLRDPKAVGAPAEDRLIDPARSALRFGAPPEHVLDWAPYGVAETIDALRGVRAPWWLSGGWGIDEFLGGQTRHHGDIDVTVGAEDWPEFLASAAARFELWSARDGELTRLGAGPTAGIRSVWLRERGDPWWRIQVNREPIERGVWRYRRDPSITLPIEVATWRSSRARCLAPYVQLLWKSPAPRPRDDHDLELLHDRLDASARDWLRASIAQAHPESPWIGLI